LTSLFLQLEEMQLVYIVFKLITINDSDYHDCIESSICTYLLNNLSSLELSWHIFRSISINMEVFILRWTFFRVWLSYFLWLTSRLNSLACPSLIIVSYFLQFFKMLFLWSICQLFEVRGQPLRFTFLGDNPLVHIFVDNWEESTVAAALQKVDNNKREDSFIWNWCTYYPLSHNSKIYSFCGGKQWTWSFSSLY